MSILYHFEAYLGETVGGWKNPGGEQWPFYVFRFDDGPVPDTVTYSTIGLSEFTLKSPLSSMRTRFELIFATHVSFGDSYIPAMLHDIGVAAISRDRGYIRGEVLKLGGKLFPGTNLESLYVTSPMYLPQEFGTVKTLDGDSCVIVWLLPITSDEAKLIGDKGWDAFEKMLVQYQPNLFDMNRPTFFAHE
jgi:hypothetical protein